MSTNKDAATWTIDTFKYIVNDRFLKLRADNCTTPQGGKVNNYYVLEYDDWVNGVAIDADDTVVMLRHYRHGVQKNLSEFISGGVEIYDEFHKNIPRPGVRAFKKICIEPSKPGFLCYGKATQTLFNK